MIFNAETSTERTKVAGYLERAIRVPVVSAQISTLGGTSRASAIIKLSLDPKKSWPNGIFQNSRYSMFHLSRDGTLEQFSLSYRLSKKFRKAKAKSLVDAVAKINKYIGQVK